MNHTTIGIISGIINIATLIPYSISVIKGRARPNRVTWGIWAFLSWVVLWASIASGAHATLFWLTAAAFNSTFIFCLSLWKGVSKKSKLELSCFILGIFGIALWYMTQKAYFSVYICILIDIIAIIPTIKKVWIEPLSEPKIAWSLGFVSALLNIVAIDSWYPVISLPPLTVVAFHLPVLIPMYFWKKTQLL